MSDLSQPDPAAPSDPPAAPRPLNPRQRRILGVLMENARTTPDAYPLSLNALVTGCNQKSNRDPILNLTADQVEAELEVMRSAGIVAEVQGGSRVAKYRHYGYDYLGVKGMEAAIMTELLLRGVQTAGDLRARASRFEPISDLATLQSHLDALVSKGLVQSLSPRGRGQLFTHNLYLPEEADQRTVAAPVEAAEPAPRPAAASPPRAAQGISRPNGVEALEQELGELRAQVADLRQRVEQLSDRLERLES